MFVLIMFYYTLIFILPFAKLGSEPVSIVLIRHKLKPTLPFPSHKTFFKIFSANFVSLILYLMCTVSTFHTHCLLLLYALSGCKIAHLHIIIVIILWVRVYFCQEAVFLTATICWDSDFQNVFVLLSLYFSGIWSNFE